MIAQIFPNFLFKSSPKFIWHLWVYIVINFITSCSPLGSNLTSVLLVNNSSAFFNSILPRIRFTYENHHSLSLPYSLSLSLYSVLSQSLRRELFVCLFVCLLCLKCIWRPVRLEQYIVKLPLHSLTHSLTNTSNEYIPFFHPMWEKEKLSLWRRRWIRRRRHRYDHTQN